MFSVVLLLIISRFFRSLLPSPVGERRIGILGTGSYLPERILSNADLEKVLDTNDEWIYKRTGIKERRIAAPDINASDLAKEDSQKAMEMAGIGANDLDLIVMTTMTPDTACPSGANWLEAKLGAERAVSFDVTAACSGFIFGLSVAEQYLKAGTFKTVLVASVEIMSRTLDWTDRESCIRWGDGCGAVVLRAFDNPPGEGPSFICPSRSACFCCSWAYPSHYSAPGPEVTAGPLQSLR